jgi:hypothetical protein
VGNELDKLWGELELLREPRKYREAQACGSRTGPGFRIHHFPGLNGSNIQRRCRTELHFSVFLPSQVYFRYRAWRIEASQPYQSCPSDKK